MTKNKFGFSPRECKILSKLNTPKKIQDFVDRIDYNLEKKGETLMSPQSILKENKAHCFEGALFAAAALRFHNYPPLIVDIVSSTEDDDHVIAVFKQKGFWGSIAKSKYTGLTFREPIHRNIRELVLTYFEGYFIKNIKTLRGYSKPVNLSRFDKLNWMTSEKDVFFIEDYLEKIKHKKLLTRTMIKNLRKVTPLMKEAGEIWIKRKGLLKKLIH
jgi:hypothetical protein